MAEPRLTRLLVLAALTAAYFVAGRFGLSLAIVNESASAVWPPTGIAVAALLLLGTQVWPVIAVGAFLVNLTTSGVAISSLAIATGNTLEGIVAAWLASRFARGRTAFDRPADVVRFTAAAVVACTIAASVGTGSLVAAGLALSSEAASVWLTWWLGDVVGAILVAPLILLWTSRPSTAWTRPSAVEVAGLVACLIAVSFGVYTGPIGARHYPLQFVVTAVLLWPAFRFGRRLTATSAVLVAAIAIFATIRGLGPFARDSINESLLLVQAFVGVTTTVMLMVAAEVGQRRAVEAEIRLRQAEEARAQLIGERAARHEAEEASRVKDRFLATLSHELRTPLNAALGWARLLLDLPPGDDRAGKALDAIYRNLLVQARLVSDIMDVSRAAAGTLALQRAPVDAAAVVHAAIETMREAAAGRSVTFRTGGLDRPVRIMGDAHRLQQVVWNLLDNALKFSGPDAMISIALMRKGDAVEISVADNGPGIDTAFLPHMFEEFRQADESTTRAHGGLGLGLAIARRIVEQHGGTIDVANRSEGGAVFTISLPAEAPVAQ
jgi:signal transduction histidine kinase